MGPDNAIAFARLSESINVRFMTLDQRIESTANNASSNFRLTLIIIATIAVPVIGGVIATLWRRSGNTA